MKLLAIETSTAACSAALWCDGELCERLVVTTNQHSRVLLPMIEELLNERALALADCAAVAFGRGPGSFTGVRLGVSVAQGIAYGAGLPTVPVSSLLALAARSAASNVVAAIDARMDQVYWAACRRDTYGKMRSLGAPRLSAPEQIVLDTAASWTGVGSGWDNYGERLTRALGEARYLAGVHPHAADVARIAVDLYADGKVVRAQAAVPEYVRDQVAHKPGGTGG